MVNKDFHQVRLVELSTDQLMMLLAMCVANEHECKEYVDKYKDSIDKGRLNSVKQIEDDIRKIQDLRKNFKGALADIMNTWGN